METTNVKATPEELAEIQKMASEARNTPVITLVSGGPDMASMAWHRVKERVHKTAMAHGLPEIEGFYGITADGEFVKA